MICLWLDFKFVQVVVPLALSPEKYLRHFAHENNKAVQESSSQKLILIYLVSNDSIVGVVYVFKWLSH